jgi:hypothetical protein
VANVVTQPDSPLPIQERFKIDRNRPTVYFSIGKSRHRQFLSVREGTYDNGVFKLIRTWNGGRTDWGLDFDEAPMVLRIAPVTD